LYPVTELAVTSFDEKELLAPPHLPRGFFLAKGIPFERHPASGRSASQVAAARADRGALAAAERQA